MNKDVLIYNIVKDCPICNGIHELQFRKRIACNIVKGEEIETEEFYFLCPVTNDEENEFISAKIMDENLLRAKDAYRQKHGLLTSNEIKNIRSYYNLTQSEFSLMLGWGEVTITRYENKAIQEEAYDKIMRMAYEDSLFALEALEKNKNKFDKSKFNLIKENILSKIKKNENLYFKQREIKSLYASFQEERDENGYKILDIEKLSAVLGYFACNMINLYKVKLMKLLWYADILYFKRNGRSMTGLVYQHMPMGALPVAHNEILGLPTVEVEEEYLDSEICGYHIKPGKEIYISNFVPEELEVLNLVVQKFKDFNGSDISKYMHKEKAYMETEPYQYIPYSLSKELNELS